MEKSIIQKPEWDFARQLQQDLKMATRRSLSAQILLGKELCSLKRKLGYLGKGANRGPEGQFVVTGKNWNQWCQEQLSICSKTVDRWIQCFEAALRRAKARKAKEPEACRLLEIPAAELTGDELELLAVCVDRLVDQDTQEGLLEELGIVKSSNKLQGGDTSQFRNATEEENLEQEALIFFASLPRKIAAMKKAIAPFRDYSKYHFFLQKLPLDDDREGKPSLMGIKEGLEAILKDGLTDVLSDLSEAIEAKNSDALAKPNKKKPSTNRRK